MILLLFEQTYFYYELNLIFLFEQEREYKYFLVKYFSGNFCVIYDGAKKNIIIDELEFLFKNSMHIK